MQTPSSISSPFAISSASNHSTFPTGRLNYDFINVTKKRAKQRHSNKFIHSTSFLHNSSMQNNEKAHKSSTIRKKRGELLKIIETKARLHAKPCALDTPTKREKKSEIKLPFN
jgi:hypothetical protein